MKIDIAGGKRLADIESEAVALTLRSVRNNQSEAARILKISRPTLARMIKRHRISKEPVVSAAQVTPARALDITSIVYKRGWSILRFELDKDTFWLQAEYDGTGEHGRDPWTGDRWTLPQDTTQTTLVNTAFKAFLAAEEFFARKHFTYEGVAVCDTEWDVNSVVQLAKSGGLKEA